MTPARVIWAASALLFFGVGVGCIWWPASMRLAQIRERASRAYDETYRNQEIVRHANEILRARARVTTELRRLDGAEPSSIGAATLSMLYRESAEAGIEIRAVTPTVAVEKSLENGERTGPSNTWTLNIHGRYRNLLKFVRDVSRRELLAEVHSVTLATTMATGATSPALDGTLEIGLYGSRSF